MENKKGLEALQRTLLIMNYDNGKTLSENSQILFEQTAPFYYQPNDYMGRKDPKSDYVFSQGGPMGKPQGAIDAKTLYPNGEPKSGYPKKLTVQQVQDIFNKNKNSFSQPLPTNLIDKFKPGYWKGKPQPEPPTEYKGSFISAPGTKLPRQPWGYYLGKLGNYDEQMKQYEQEFDLWQQENDPEGRVNRTRKTAKGKDVPEGFWPSEYDEYLEKIKPYQDYIKTIEGYYSKKVYNRSTDEFESEFHPKDIPQGDKKKYDDAKSQIEKIKKEYYHAEFLGGISKEEFARYLSYTKALSDYWVPKIAACHSKAFQSKDYGDIGSYTPKRTYVDDRGELQSYGGQSKALGAGCLKLEVQYKTQIRELQKVFGKDMRSSFDKFWDEWGTWIQVGGSILLGFTGPLAPVLDGAFNLAIAGYQAQRGQYADAGVSVVFAMLPAVSGLLNIGKIPKSVSQSIGTKLAAAEIRTSKELADFIITLPKEEQVWFKELAKTSPKQFSDAAKQVTNRYLQRTGQELTPKLEQTISSAFAGKAANIAKKAAKISFKKPLLQRLKFDAAVIFSGQKFASHIENLYYEANKEKMSEEVRKRYENFYNSIPQEVRSQVLSDMQVQTLNNIGSGNVEKAVDEIFDRPVLKPDGTAYTKKELDELNRKTKEKLKKFD